MKATPTDELISQIMKSIEAFELITGVEVHGIDVKRVEAYYVENMRSQTEPIKITFDFR